MTVTDQALGSLSEYLDEKLGSPPGFDLRDLRQLSGGWSRMTYAIETAFDGPDGPAARTLIVRVKPPAGLLGTDIEREYLTMRGTHVHGLPVPEPLWYESEGRDVFEGPFYVSEHVEGRAANTWRRSDRHDLEQQWSADRRLAEEFVENLARIHSLPLDDFEFLGSPMEATDLVEQWRGVYDEVRLVRDPAVEEAFALVEARARPARRMGIVHGDYRVGNMLVQDGSLRAILDWELSHIGDPLFDIGYCTLDYIGGRLLSPGSALASAVCDEEWLYQRYSEITGESVDRGVVETHRILSAAILMVILLTGLRAFHDGNSTDIRLAWGRYAVVGLRESLVELLGWRRPDRP